MMMSSLDAELRRVCAAVVPSVPRPPEGQRGPQPSISADEVYSRALVVADQSGTRGLEARRLAAHLGISTRTLYKRIGNQDNLFRGVAALYLSSLSPDYVEGDTWEATALNWCEGLRQALCDRPHLTELLTNAALPVGEAVDAPIALVGGQDDRFRLAVDCCRALVDVTFNQAIRDVRSMLRPPSDQDTGSVVRSDPTTFHNTIRWILAGVRSESVSS